VLLCRDCDPWDDPATGRARVERRGAATNASRVERNDGGSVAAVQRRDAGTSVATGERLTTGTRDPTDRCGFDLQCVCAQSVPPSDLV
jgi:hypothetical protein